MWKSEDPGFFESVYRRFKKPILVHVLGKVKNPHTAEEITQEVFIKAFRFRGKFDPRFEFSTWLWAIANNTITDWFRKMGRSMACLEEIANEPTEIDALPSPTLNPELALLEKTHRTKLAQAMTRLTEPQKRALLLRLIHQLSYHEIARKLGLSLSAVKCLVHRAKLTLIRGLDEGTVLISFEGLHSALPTRADSLPS